MPAGAAHNTSVVYADVVVPGDRVDLAGWECWNHRDTGVWHFYASGPCPACGATVQGHIDDAPRPVESQGADDERSLDDAEREPVEVPLRCGCDAAHGRDGGKTGCGRRWSILCPWP